MSITLMKARSTGGQNNLNGGWIQINNTLVPYVSSASTKLLSLAVLRQASDLFTNLDTIYRRATRPESRVLNSLCRKVGISFRFARHTRLVALEEIVSKTKAVHKKVDKGEDNSFKHISCPEGRVKPIDIRPRQFKNKTILCLVDDDQHFALLEVFVRVYFPEKSLDYLLLALKRMNLPTRELTLREELAFIAYYDLPTRALHCTKVVDIGSVADHYAELESKMRHITSINSTTEQRHSVKKLCLSKTSSKEVVQSGTANEIVFV